MVCSLQFFQQKITAYAAHHYFKFKGFIKCWLFS